MLKRSGQRWKETHLWNDDKPQRCIQYDQLVLFATLLSILWCQASQTGELDKLKRIHELLCKSQTRMVVTTSCTCILSILWSLWFLSHHGQWNLLLRGKCESTSTSCYSCVRQARWHWWRKVFHLIPNPQVHNLSWHGPMWQSHVGGGSLLLQQLLLC